MAETRTYGWGWTLLWFVGGMVGPAACLVIELGSRMCRKSLFDPLPTPWHVVLVGLVPVATYAGLKALAQPEWRTRATGILLGGGLCTTLMYALPFVPLLPFALLLSLMGIGLLGLAPLLAPLATGTLAARLSKLGVRGFTIGFLGCVLVLALVDIGAVRTIRAVGEQYERSSDAGEAWLREHGDRAILEELACGGLSARPLAWIARRQAGVKPKFVREHWQQFTGEAPSGELLARWND